MACGKCGSTCNDVGVHAARLIRELIVLQIGCSAEGPLTDIGHRDALEKAFKREPGLRSSLVQVVISQVGIARRSVTQLCRKSRAEFERQAPAYFGTQDEFEMSQDDLQAVFGTYAECANTLAPSLKEGAEKTAQQKKTRQKNRQKKNQTEKAAEGTGSMDALQQEAEPDDQPMAATGLGAVADGAAVVGLQRHGQRRWPGAVL